MLNVKIFYIKNIMRTILLREKQVYPSLCQTYYINIQLHAIRLNMCSVQMTFVCYTNVVFLEKRDVC